MFNDIIEIEKKDGSVEQMGLDEFSRWMCLIEAFDFISKKADELGLHDVEKLMKPLAIEKYLEERFPSMRYDVGVEHSMGIL